MIVDHVVLTASEQIEAHSQDTWELSYIIKGHGRRTIGDRSEAFGPGDMALVIPGMTHQWSFEGESDTIIENISVMFENSLIDRCFSHIFELTAVKDFFSSLNESIMLDSGSSGEIARTLVSMVSADEAERTLKLMQILYLVSKSSDLKSTGHFVRNESREDKLQKVRVYVRCNYKRKITIRDVSEHIGMSETGFCNFWKQMTGSKFWDYVTGERIEAACHLLNISGVSVSDACYQSGFNDLAYFCKTFKKRKGMTPSQYRSIAFR